MFEFLLCVCQKEEIEKFVLFSLQERESGNTPFDTHTDSLFSSEGVSSTRDHSLQPALSGFHQGGCNPLTQPKEKGWSRKAASHQHQQPTVDLSQTPINETGCPEHSGCWGLASSQAGGRKVEELVGWRQRPPTLWMSTCRRSEDIAITTTTLCSGKEGIVVSLLPCL